MASRPTTTERGYGATHQKERARLKPAVDAGQANCTELICLEQTRWIRPGTHWDLAHDRTRPGRYLGPAHRRCNRAEGARHKNLITRQQIRRWTSRNW